MKFHLKNGKNFLIQLLRLRLIGRFKMAKKKSMEKLAIRGIVSALLASLCCVTPLAVVLVGFGSLSIALSFLRYRPYFLALGIIFLSVATYIYLKRDYGKCNLFALKKAKYSIIGTFALMIFIYVGLTYFLIPPILVSSVENSIQKSAAQANYQNATEMKIKISGMTCRCNIADIEYNLMQTEGVLNVSIDYDSGIGIIKFDSSKTNQFAILQNKIFSSTYSAELIN